MRSLAGSLAYGASVVLQDVWPRLVCVQIAGQLAQVGLCSVLQDGCPTLAFVQ